MDARFEGSGRGHINGDERVGGLEPARRGVAHCGRLRGRPTSRRPSPPSESGAQTMAEPTVLAFETVEDGTEMTMVQHG
jgi:hypothetical protein